MKKVLIYVLSSAVQPYPELAACAWDTWGGAPCEGTDTWIYTSLGSPIRGQTVMVSDAEGYYNMGRKDISAYEHALKSWHDWDYMARVNVSCYVSKRRLIEHVQSLPETGVFQGVGAPRQDGAGMYLWGGMQFVMSRDVVSALLLNRQLWNHNEMEDMAMSRLAENCGFKLDMNGHGCSVNKQPGHWLVISYGNGAMGGFEFTDFDEFAQKNKSHFIRVKQDGDRSGDMMIMRELHKRGV